MKQKTAALMIMVFMMFLFIAPSPSMTKVEASEWELTFEDNFDGDSLDKSKWSYDIGNGFYQEDGSFISGWGNEELQSYQKENVRVEDGKLILEAREEEVSDDQGTYNYTSGKIHTKGKFKQTYGRFEAKMSLPEGQGFWPAFWMMPEEDIYGGWAASGEIDIMENAGGTPTKIGGAIHYGSQWPNNTYTAKDYYFPEGQDITDMNVYAVEWEPGEIRWYVNDHLYQTLNNWSSKDGSNPAKFAYPAPFDQDFYLILNLAVGGWYGGKPNDDTVFPSAVEVEYVRAYQRSGYPEPEEPAFEAEELPDDAKEAIDGNYVYDMTYSKGFQKHMTHEDVANKWDAINWNFLTLGDFGGEGSISTEAINEDTFARIDISKPGNQTYSLQLIQNVPLGKGRYYKLSFDAKAEANRSINVKIGGGEARGWTAYSPNADYALTTEANRYEMVFQMQHETDAAARLEFNVGNNGQGVSIGNVVLEEVSPVDPFNENDSKRPLPNGNHVYNGTFDQGTMDRLTYWHVDTNDAEVNAYVPADIRQFVAEIIDGGDNKEAITLRQKGIQLTATDEYKLSFKAKAKASREIQVGLMSEDGTVEYALEPVTLADEFSEYVVNFTMAQPEDLNSQLVFFLGGNDQDVVLDNIVLVRLTNNNTRLTLEDRFPLRNGKFNEGLKYFDVHNHGLYEPSSDAALGVENGMFVADIKATGWEPWHVMLMQNAMQFKGNQTYTLSFDAQSTIERQIDVSIENISYHRYLSEIVTVTPEEETFSFTFTMPQDDSVDIKFLLGAIEEVTNLPEHQVKIDNILLEIEGSSAEAFLLTNGDFAADFADWTTHNQGNYGDNPSQAQFTVEDGMAKITVEHAGLNPWDISLSQEEKVVKEGGNYTISFDAYATTAREIEAVIDNGAPGGYHRYLNEKVALTPERQSYSFDITIPKDDIVGLKFLLGALTGVPEDAHDIIIDNVRFEVSGVREYLYGLEASSEAPGEDDTVSVEDNDVDKVEQTQKLVIVITDEKVTKVTLSSQQIEQLQAKDATIIIKKLGVEVELSSHNLNGDIIIELSPSTAAGLTHQDVALSDIVSFTISENGAPKTTFTMPVTLRFALNTEDLDTSTLGVYYFNPESATWELVGGTYSEGMVVVDVDHFSTFAVFNAGAFDQDTPDEDLTGDTPGEEGQGEDPTGNTPGEEGQDEDPTGDTSGEENESPSNEDVTMNEVSEMGEHQLPSTATNIYLLLLAGAMLLMMSGTVLVFHK
ncbi:hypothetical protein GCM10012290_08310 [Halolactibacillus alkaliphilus]|uniref:GH16 domain-containing protein n=1 Tax=Halolactibacillus alkaliphilus TaxID=442899 RepID=A0A511X091_9BACI|nr:carbohydrate binding domain-containing protein [Halolactibacillus alkaliphilus]GEN56341.1 hypothetical protein HAL01_08050 [Halolactibacillus alkaliphilus]GGN67617.1 hypothetical protein GCM10012290_08310 [Halolactibacillus alkaliphilus]SFO78748.1 Beta-glucanase, GH16 family [Halolactibacillus alkaliphilus]